jgi:hypothetical protein
MKAVIRELAVTVPLELEVIDIDDSAALREKFGNEIPVLLVDGRKAFKYRVTKEELERQLGREVRRKPLFRFSK